MSEVALLSGSGGIDSSSRAADTLLFAAEKLPGGSVSPLNQRHKPHVSDAALLRRGGPSSIVWFEEIVHLLMNGLALILPIDKATFGHATLLPLQAAASERYAYSLPRNFGDGTQIGIARKCSLA